MSPGDRIVVTGIGAVSAYGWGCGALQAGLMSGVSAISTPRCFDTGRHRTRLAGEVPPAPDDVEASIERWTSLSRADRFAVAAAAEAIAQSGLQTFGETCGVFFGGSTAGTLEGEEWYARLIGTREGHPALRLLASQQLNGPGDAVARHFGAAGPVQSFSSACSSAGLAVGAAIDSLRDGEVNVAIAGGSDSLCELTYGGFNSLRSVDPAPCRPFRSDRAGLNLGEGAAVLVLERFSDADRRGASPIAELLGYGASCDAHHMTAPHPDGDGILRAMRQALTDSGRSPGDVTFINSHGTGTPHNDPAEARAYGAVFGDGRERVPITASKSSIGHVLGAAGALEAVATVLAITSSWIQPTAGDQPADPDLDIDLVLREPREIGNDVVAISINLAFGGANAALVFGSCREGCS